jgi:hypothetical protein
MPLQDQRVPAGATPSEVVRDACADDPTTNDDDAAHR